MSAEGSSSRGWAVTGGATRRLLGQQGPGSLTGETGFSSVGFSHGCDKVQWLAAPWELGGRGWGAREEQGLAACTWAVVPSLPSSSTRSGLGSKGLDLQD